MVCVAVSVAVVRCCCRGCGVAVSVAASRSMLQSVFGSCSAVVMCCDVAVKVGDAVFRSVVQSVQMS